MEDYQVSLTANAGVLLNYHNKRILIDGLHKAAMHPFQGVSQDLLDRIISGHGSVGQVTIALFTHNHKDHFDHDSVRKMVELNDEVVVYGPSAMCQDLRRTLAKDSDRQRIIDVDLSGKPRQIGDGIYLTSLPLPHDGKKYAEVENVGYLLDVDGLRVLHLGDASVEAVGSDRSRALTDQVDLALLNFPFVTLDKGRRVIKEVIQAHKVYVLHLPNPLKDEFDWIGKTRQAMARYREDLPEIEVLTCKY